MITPEVEKAYRKARGPFIGGQCRAANALAFAKAAIWVDHNWLPVNENGVALSLDGNWRLRIEPDEWRDLDDLFGDTYDIDIHAGTVPGGARTIKAQYKAAIARIERDGVWGWILERKCGACGNWEHVDSCWGYDGEVPEEELIFAQFQASK